ncbi:uncharacterized protein BKA78DRAFT_320086 [Phyllosticta capitalensis]|uniref:uncharacterized protein n=1 Tax=Phyllosticta capitalensis TaxID=121624 RepID=UPI00312D848F
MHAFIDQTWSSVRASLQTSLHQASSKRCEKHPAQPTCQNPPSQAHHTAPRQNVDSRSHHHRRASLADMIN